MIDIEAILNEMQPYTNGEAKEAISRILAKEEFDSVLQFVFTNQNIDKIKENLKAVRTAYEFQMNFSKRAVKAVIDKTTSDFSYSGIEQLDSNTPYLFISNHRDIVLDSAIMQYVLLCNGHKSTQITFGSNLMSSQFVIDLGKINKMFTFYRGGNRNEIYRNALVHSAYIHKVITQEKESVWIAQRDGRTKDGDDRTQLSLLKMLTIKSKNQIERLKEYNIIPISISYEYEPCDTFKVKERLNTIDGNYEKSKDEDYMSVVNGITGLKGKVHLAFGEPINHFLEDNKEMINRANVHQKVCDEIDRQVHLNYHLNKINYIAHDLMSDKKQFLNSQYQESDINQIESLFIDKVNEITDKDYDKAMNMLMRMYLLPVINKKKYEK